MPSYVVVGASRGIGYEFLKQISSDSSNKVVGIARNKEATQSQVDADKLPVHIVQGDLTDPASLNAAAEETAKYTGGAVDYLIINGAYMGTESMFLTPSACAGNEKLFLDELTTSINTNTAGVLYATNAFLPYVRKSSIKKVTVLSSGHADTEFMEAADVSNAIAYAISKAGANIIMAKYAAELKSEGFVFLALSPGVVLTAAPSLDYLPAEFRAVYDNMTKQFQKYEPNFKGPITPAESVEKCLKVIDGITVKDSGAFLSHFGTKHWL